MREQIVIQSVVETRTSTGAISSAWSTFATVRCSVEPLNGREYFAMQAVTTANTVKFRNHVIKEIIEKSKFFFSYFLAGKF